MIIQNISNKYTLNEFTTTDIFTNYSPFCQKAIKYISDQLTNAKIPYVISTRNGTDKKITFTIKNPIQRNLLTLHPNLRKNYIKAEIHDEYNSPNPFKTKIQDKEDFDELIIRIKSLYNTLTNSKPRANI